MRLKTPVCNTRAWVMLNAPQWFKFIRVHLQHHLKQLERIKNNFAKG